MLLTSRSIIQAHAQTQWQALPSDFRLEGPLRMCNRKPIERDFLVSARLNYLHVLLLLRMSLAQHVPAKDDEIIAISASMLSLTVEALILKSQLANSGTGLIWRVSTNGVFQRSLLMFCRLRITAFRQPGLLVCPC